MHIHSKYHLFSTKIPKKQSKTHEIQDKKLKILVFGASSHNGKLKLGKGTTQVMHKQMTAGFKKDLHVFREIFGLSIDDRRNIFRPLRPKKTT